MRRTAINKLSEEPVQNRIILKWPQQDDNADALLRSKDAKGDTDHNWQIRRRAVGSAQLCNLGCSLEFKHLPYNMQGIWGLGYRSPQSSLTCLMIPTRPSEIRKYHKIYISTT
ncbi:hypothetical protein Hamer_G010690 [Homarus americanus]|uniref:Uncharacterized protein n=1 Tax=Homarus americanus TaxID=6706 RepID=A0A8J5J9G0_HOMAM|nr:hypothetical protein Hamer_G010690 [Homarus americanus]